MGMEVIYVALFGNPKHRCHQESSAVPAGGREGTWLCHWLCAVHLSLFHSEQHAPVSEPARTTLLGPLGTTLKAGAPESIRSLLFCHFCMGISISHSHGNIASLARTSGITAMFVKYVLPGPHSRAICMLANLLKIKWPYPDYLLGVASGLC